MSRFLLRIAALNLALAPMAALAQDAPPEPQGEAGGEKTMTDIVELTRAWLKVMPEGDFDAFPGEVSPDFVLYLPFVPPGVPTEIRGREKVRETLEATAQGRSKLVLSDVVIRRTEDPELVVTTAKGEATMANGKPYRNSYVIFTRIRDGVVLEHTEYLNPLAIMEAAGN